MQKFGWGLFLLLCCVIHAMAQDRAVTGIVTDKTGGTPLPGVSIRVKGTSSGTLTSPEGKFSLKMPQGQKQLVVSFIGYLTQEVTVTNADINGLNIALVSNSQQLSELVVTAGGIKRTVREQGYASTSLKGAEINQAKVNNIATGLTGKVAGLQINTVGSGVNPNVRIVLRGSRSLTGNNQALVVLDNVIVPNNVLTSLNPEDIENVTVLNGANAAALYGSDASNGALLVTTKRGRKGMPQINVSQTVAFENVSFFPAFQDKFGSGSKENAQEYIPFENQQYGPAYNGSMVQIGKPLEDGSVQMVPYSATNDRKDFWNTGVTSQTNFAVNAGDDKSTTYFSGSYVKSTGTTPEDKYNRAVVRLNGTRNLGNKVSVAYSSAYTQSNTNTTFADIYDLVLNTPGQIPLTRYRDWQNNPFANPNGFYNEYFPNPYFQLDNNRQKIRNEYFTGNGEVKWDPLDWLNFTYRIGISSNNSSYKRNTGKFTFSNYTKDISPSKTDIAGSAEDGNSYNTQLNSDFLIQFNKHITKDFGVKFIVGNSIRQNSAKVSVITTNGLVNESPFNVGNRTGEPGAAEADYIARQIGVFGDLTLSYKNYLFLHASGRNDWTSVLAPDNRSFFYPGVDVSFVPTDAIEWLKGNKVIDFLKLRAGYSKVGQVNLSQNVTLGSYTYSNFGAYNLVPTFSATSGFPYGSLPGFSLDNTLTSANLKPEFTKGYEGGFDLNLLQNRLSTNVTYYNTLTENQTVTAGVSTASGYSAYRLNAGSVRNWGIEAALHVTPVRLDNGLEITVGGNYNYKHSEVVSISPDQDELAISTGGLAQVYVIKGQPLPVIKGSDYKRDPQGRIIVDPITGYPSKADQLKILGNTEPLHILALDATASWKGFRLAVLFEYRGSFYRDNEVGATMDFTGASARSAQYNRDRFVIPNSSYEDPNHPGQYIANTSIQVQDGGPGFWSSDAYNRSIASNYVTRGDYWKLRELSLSYNVPASVLHRTKVIQNAVISLQGRNLFTWLPRENKFTDPDYNFTDGNAVGINNTNQTPPTRYIGATVSLTF